MIDDEHVGMILREDGYRKLDNPSEAVLGDVVVYRNDGGEISHVGILVSVQLQLEVGGQELTVLSQWGADGEYFHRIDDVNPRLGQPTEIWTDRK
jgi:cell wall-associated NlpC family hydrolase